MQVLVIGGTLFIGKLLVKELLKAGHKVTILHRKPGHGFGKRVDELIADRNDAASLARALTGRHFDAVYDNVYDWERGTTADQVSATARLVGDKLQRYVFLSSVAAYGDGLNHQEGDGLAKDDHPDSYVRNKAQSERALFRLHQRHGLPAVTLRPPYVYGPDNPFYREQFFWDRLKAGRPVLIPGDGRRLMQFVYVKDLVAAGLAVLEIPGAVGHAFNVANPRPVSQLDLVHSFAAAAKVQPVTVHVPREHLQAAGGHPMRSPLYFGVYYDMAPITMVTQKIQRVLKWKATPFEQGLKETYRWYSKEYTGPAQNFDFEDKMIGIYRPKTA
ncbi:MAG: NAD-dependent epimerase/dehydratase family protein [Acidobacteria bacterium]|nr:NAD-dependent epimerase/dehydratase family protein [Acidobacteriota bacterium]